MIVGKEGGRAARTCIPRMALRRPDGWRATAARFTVSRASCASYSTAPVNSQFLPKKAGERALARPSTDGRHPSWPNRFRSRKRRAGPPRLSDRTAERIGNIHNSVESVFLSRRRAVARRADPSCRWLYRGQAQPSEAHRAADQRDPAHHLCGTLRRHGRHLSAPGFPAAGRGDQRLVGRCRDLFSHSAAALCRLHGHAPLSADDAFGLRAAPAHRSDDADRSGARSALPVSSTDIRSPAAYSASRRRRPRASM